MATRPRYRLMIEGCPTEWVTDHTLATTTSDGRVRRVGLQYEGLEIAEKLSLRESDIRVSGITARIVSGFADHAFAYHPDYLAMLDSNIDEDDSTLYTDTDTGQIATDDYLHIGTETLKVTSVSGTSISIQRQRWDTQAQGHYAQVGEKAESIPIYNRVPSYEGRRAYLFLYDEGDTSDGDPLFDFSVNKDGRDTDTADTVIWRGIISRPPRLHRDGITWLLDIQPITFVLEQEIAKTEVNLAVKGIYLHAFSGLYIRCTDYDNSGVYTEDTVFGFYPTEEDFLTAVNTALETLRTTAFTYAPQSITLNWDKNLGYKLAIHINASNDSEINVMITSPLLGATGAFGSGYKWIREGDEDNDGWSVGGGVGLSNDVEYYKLIDPNVTEVIFGELSDVPATLGVFAPSLSRRADVENSYKKKNVIFNTNGDRVILGTPIARTSSRDYQEGMIDLSLRSTHPIMRLYLDHDPGPVLDTGSVLFISGIYRGAQLSAYFDVLDTGTHGTYGTYYADVDSFDPGFKNSFPVTWDSNIKLVYDYGSKNNIAGLIDNVVGFAVQANKGGTPFVTYADISYLSTVALMLSIPNKWAFRFFGPKVIMDLVREHLKLYGWYYHLNSVGQIAFAKYEPATVETGAIDATIDETCIVTPNGRRGMFPQWEPAIDGVVSVVEIARGYNWQEDDFKESDQLTVRDVLSISTHKNRSRGVTRIEARGNYRGGSGNSVPIEECYELAAVYLSSHSRDYDVVELAVNSDILDDVVCGSRVKVTSPHIPDSSTGTRGIEDKVGIVIGRKKYLDPQKGAEGSLTIRIDREQLRGYAPALRVTAYTVYSGYTYTCTVEASYNAPTGYNDTSFFSVSDKVRVTEFKSAASPNSQTGTLAAISSTTSVRVTLSTTFPTSSSGAWDIEFDVDSGALNSGQTDYCYIADSNGLLYNNTVGRRFV